MTDILPKTQYGLLTYHLLTFEAELTSDIRQNGEKGSWLLGGMWADKEVIMLLAKRTLM